MKVMDGTTNHDRFQSLSNSAFAFLPFVHGSPQSDNFLLAPFDFNLSLLAPDHSSFEGGVGRLAF
jgi:hypothetical protein